MGWLAKLRKIDREYGGLILLGLIQEFSLILFLLITGLKRGSSLLEIIFWVPFAVYIFTIWKVIRERPDGISSWKKIAVVILFFSFLFHITLLLSTQPLSDDLYRYLWDGKVLSHGINPYAHNAFSYDLMSLRDANWSNIQNKDAHSIYPPLAQLFFALAYGVRGDLLGFKLMAVGFSLASVGLIMMILKELGVDIRRAVIYGWSPLVAMEFANSAHIDSMAIFWVLCSIYAWLNQRNVISAALMAFAVAGKVYPLLFAGLFAPDWGKKGTLVFGVSLLGMYIPFIATGVPVFGGMQYFIQYGYFNGSIFPILLSGLAGVLGIFNALVVSKIGVLLLFSGAGLFLFAKVFKDRTDKRMILKSSYWLTGLFLLISPTVHPWYLTWILPFLCFFPSAAWIYLSGAVVLARTVYIDFEASGLWKENGWIRLCEYLPFYALLVFESFKKRKLQAQGALARV